MTAALLILGGLVALVVGAELLVRGASRLAAACGISSLVIGLTVVAFGTSAPEMAVAVKSALTGRADILVGNVVGSNIFNVLCILGASAAIVPLVVDQKLIRFDVPLMIAVSFLAWGFARDAVIGRAEGTILFAGILIYTVWCIVAARNESAEIRREYDEAFRPDGVAAPPANDAGSRWKRRGVDVLLIGLGLGLLVLGASWLVDGATIIARAMGVSELVIGLTIVAGGTSLPELATSLVAALKGERDIAVGNIVGSNLFNLLGVLGLSAAVSPDGVPVAEQALQFDIPVMVVVAVACLPVFFTGHMISRWEGAVFLGYFVAYLTALVMMATHSSALPGFRLLILGFAVPLTAITLIVAVVRSRKQRSGDDHNVVD